MRKPNKENILCPHCKSKPTIKIGLKKNKQRTTQRYQCKSCKRSFTLQPSHQKHKTHDIKTILNAISKYNLGIPLRKQEIPKSTIHNWIKAFNLPMNRLRNQITDPNKVIIKKHFRHHNQPFMYQYHTLKLRFLKDYPGLKKYLTHLYIPKDTFKDSQRISQLAKQIPTTMARASRGLAPSEWRVGQRPSEANVVVGISESDNNVGVSKSIYITKKQNYATKLAQLAKEITTNNKERHQIIENFMLINDSTTIATEIPIYHKNLTGHIDLLQIRYNKIYILDYKPEPINKKQTIKQLTLYKNILAKRTYTKDIKIAFFNENGYYQI